MPSASTMRLPGHMEHPARLPDVEATPLTTLSASSPLGPLARVIEGYVPEPPRPQPVPPDPEPEPVPVPDEPDNDEDEDEDEPSPIRPD